MKSGLLARIRWSVCILKYHKSFIIIIIIIIICEFFTPALVDGISLGSKWQQVSSSLQDSSQYSNQF